MRCEFCQGTGWAKGRTFNQVTVDKEAQTVRRRYDRVVYREPAVPCKECGGCGIAHCCEGEVTQ